MDGAYPDLTFYTSLDSGLQGRYIPSRMFGNAVTIEDYKNKDTVQMAHSTHKGYSILEKLGFALLITAWVLFGANYAGNMLVASKPLEKPAYVVASDTEAGEQAEPTPTAEAEPMKDALALLATADLARGAKLFKKCAGCHNAVDGGKNKVGPNLWGILGSNKTAVSGFKYSDALKDKGGNWSFAELDAFLASPKTFAPGTKMSFRGFNKPEDRAAVLAFLRTLSSNPVPLP